MNSNDAIKNGYHDWLELLKRTNNMSLLTDPYNVWLEAFMTATLYERIGVVHMLNKMIREAKTIDAQNILTEARAMVEAKGLSR